MFLVYRLLFKCETLSVTCRDGLCAVLWVFKYTTTVISATAKDETKFVEEAIQKLLKARRVLKYSYVYGYYLDGPPYRKIVFEFMQVDRYTGYYSIPY